MTAFVALLCWGLAGWSLWRDRRIAEVNAGNTAGVLARSLEGLSSSQLEQAQHSLNAIQYDLYAARYSHDLGDATIERALERTKRTDPASEFLFVLYNHDIFAVTHQAWIVRNPAVLTVIREVATAGPRANGIIGQPVQVPGESGWFLPVFSRREHSDARVVIVGSLVSIDRFFGPFQRVETTGGYSAGLMTQDGMLIFLLPHEERFIGAEKRPYGQTRAAQGGFPAHGVSLASREEAMFTEFASPVFPISALVGIETSKVMAPWWERVGVVGSVTLFASLAIAFLFSYLWRATGRVVEASQLYSDLFRDISDAVLLTDADGRIQSANAKALELLGASQLDDLHGALLVSFSAGDSQGIRDELHKHLRIARTGEPRACHAILSRLDQGEARDCEIRLSAFTWDGEDYILCLARDVSEQVRHLREQEHLANHDALTGLPNRFWLIKRLQTLIETCALPAFAVLLIDLNRFKEINDSLGHHVGDLVLREVCRRAALLLKQEGGEIARLGGDELAVILPGIIKGEDAVKVAERILESIRQPIEAKSMLLEVGASIGIALYPSDGTDQTSLLRDADVAMYVAKRHALGTALYASVSDGGSSDRLMLYAQLSEAVRLNLGLSLAYQPKVELRSGRLVGFEALLRWNHPERGSVSPGEFIPLAENTELIHPLTEWVVNRALAQAAAWAVEGITIPVAINVSVNNLQHAGFVHMLGAALERHGVAPALLEVEITESALMDRPDLVLGRVRQIRALGVQLSIDDFGTGYSSLAYLKRLPIQTLKLDRTFVASMAGNAVDNVIVRSTIMLAHGLGIQIVAEGVEDASTVDALLTLGCDLAQGYFFARPMPPADAIRWQGEAVLAAS